MSSFSINSNRSEPLIWAIFVFKFSISFSRFLICLCTLFSSFSFIYNWWAKLGYALLLYLSGLRDPFATLSRERLSYIFSSLSLLRSFVLIACNFRIYWLCQNDCYAIKIDLLANIIFWALERTSIDAWYFQTIRIFYYLNMLMMLLKLCL